MRLAASLASALALALAGSACVTRTVYVVDDNPQNDAPAPRTARAAPAPVAEPDVAPAPAPAPAPRAEGYAVEDEAGVASVDDFYEPLSPYGEWVAYPGYGRVFVPAQAVVGAGFRPYTYGHWEYSEWGWTWVDHSPFGWATGHYGRWFYDGSYGWVWVPGTRWAPAWVTWRTGGGYAGWAPLPPGAEYGSPYSVYDTSWVFVPYGSLGSPYVGSVIVVGPGYQTCFVETYPAYDTVVVNGRTYYRGPDEDDVARGGGHVVHRPAHEIDHDHPVTRPPEGATRTRPAAASSGRTRDGASSTNRDSGRGTARESDAGRGTAREGDSGRGNARDDGRGDARAVPDRDGGVTRPVPGRDGRRVPAADDGRPTPDDVRPANPDRRVPASAVPERDHGQARPDLDDLNPNAAARPVDIAPREDPAGAVDPRGARPITPRPLDDRGVDPRNADPRQPDNARRPSVDPRFVRPDNRPDRSPDVDSTPSYDRGSPGSADRFGTSPSRVSPVPSRVAPPSNIPSVPSAGTAPPSPAGPAATPTPPAKKKTDDKKKSDDKKPAKK